jgi:hypothetical protein
MHSMCVQYTTYSSSHSDAIWRLQALITSERMVGIAFAVYMSESLCSMIPVGVGMSSPVSSSSGVML